MPAHMGLGFRVSAVQSKACNRAGDSACMQCDMHAVVATLVEWFNLNHLQGKARQDMRQDGSCRTTAAKQV